MTINGKLNHQDHGSVSTPQRTLRQAAAAPRCGAPGRILPLGAWGGTSGTTNSCRTSIETSVLWIFIGDVVKHLRKYGDYIGEYG